MASRRAANMSAHADTSTREATATFAAPAEALPPEDAPAADRTLPLAEASASAETPPTEAAKAVPSPEPEPEQGSDTAPDEDNQPAVDLARVAWLATVVGCLVAVAVLALQGYIGYAGVTFAVAVSAATNLF